MQHGHARFAIEQILVSKAFDRRAMALWQAACLSDQEQPSATKLTPELCTSLMTKAASLPVLTPTPQSGFEINHIPESPSALLEVMLPVVIAHPQQAGWQMLCMQALVDCWHHASRQERHQLLDWWYQASIQRPAPDDSWVHRDQLAQWQHDVPTMFADEEPRIADLNKIIDEPSQSEAYGMLANYLNPDLNVRRFCKMLGTLAKRFLLHQFDPQAQYMDSALGFAACKNLYQHAGMVDFITTLSQQVFQLRWVHRTQQGPELTNLAPEEDIPLSIAVNNADFMGAQRAARNLSHEPELFWHSVNGLLAQALERPGNSWLRALDACHLINMTGNSDNIAPDNAATIGAALAFCNWQHQQLHPKRNETRA